MERVLTCIVCPRGCRLTVELDGGKTYNIEYVNVYNDADFDAIDIFQDLFPS